MCKYNFSKKFSNDSNVLKLNSKIDGEIAIGLTNNTNTDDGIYWFILKDNSILRLDSINDNLTKEQELPNSVKFRGDSIPKAIKKINYDMIISASAFDSLYVLKDNSIYRFDYDGVAHNKENTFVEENKLGSISDNEQILLIDNRFVKTTEGVYEHGVLNEEETEKYADVEQEYGYKKLEISKYLSKIIYIDENSIVTIDGKVYI